MDLPPLLRRHVEAFNVGVRSGDFGPMVAPFTDDADLVFVGVPVGPFHGRDAIADAYRTQPPDDEIDVLEVVTTEPVIEAVYAWRRDGGRRAGTMTITPAGDGIARLVITFDEGE
jgi:steroid Delta-isomerase